MPADILELVASRTGHFRLESGHHVYLMCDDLERTMKELAAKGVQCGDIDRERWGIRTTIRLPSGGSLGLYQPTHPTALDL